MPDATWVFIVQHSDNLHYQILATKTHKPARPKWYQMIMRGLRTAARLYGLPPILPL